MTKIEYTGPDGDRLSWAVPAQPPDPRHDSRICHACLRSISARRANRSHAKQVCKLCHSMNLGKPEFDEWIGYPRLVKRMWITAEYGIDPASEKYAGVPDLDAEYAELAEDADGLPLSVKARRGASPFGAGTFARPFVRLYWNVYLTKPGVVGAHLLVQLYQ